MRRHLFAAALALTSAPAFADPGDLANELIAGMQRALPDQTHSLRFDGCAMIQIHASHASGTWVSEQAWWLADWQTDPERVVIEEQRTSVNRSMIVQSTLSLTPSADLAGDPELARLSQAMQELADRQARGEFNALMPRASELRTDLQAAILAGEFGERLARNAGWVEGTTDTGRRQSQIYGFPVTHPQLTFRGLDAAEIARALHAHAERFCP